MSSGREDNRMTRTSLCLSVSLMLIGAAPIPAYADDLDQPPGPGATVEIGPEVDVGPAVEIGQPGEPATTSDG